MNRTKQKSWPQRLLALLAVVALCAALPAAALAEENTASIQTQVSETDKDIPWADPPQSTPETGRPDPAVPTPPPQDPATPETAQTGEHLEGYSLSLGETVTIYFYVTLPEDTPQDAAMQFTLPDSTVTQVAVADAKQVEVNGKSCTAFPCQVAAKQLTDDIEARMVVNGKYGPVYTYTVKDYLNYLLEHDYPQQAKELAGTLLVYGGKAQLYFDYRTDALAGTAEPNSTANWGSYQFESSGTQTDDYYGSSLLLEPVIQIRHYFMVPDGAECTFTFAWNAGEPETELQPVDTNTRFDGKKVYYVVTPAIAFRRADAMPVVAMRQNGADLCILRYGVFSYGDMVRALAAMDESQLPLLNLLRALDDLTTAAQRYSVAGCCRNAPNIKRKTAMKQKIILAVVVAAVVLAAAFALHRPQAGTQPTPEPTRKAETNDAVPAEPTPQPAATAEPQPTATTVPQQTTAPKPPQKPATKKTPVLNAAGQPTASAAPAENGDGEPADNTKEPTETPPPSETPTPPVDEENIELPFVPAES